MLYNRKSYHPIATTNQVIPKDNNLIAFNFVITIMYSDMIVVTPLDKMRSFARPLIFGLAKVLEYIVHNAPMMQEE